MSPRDIPPEVRKAVVHLLEAEQAWSRAYDAWSHTPAPARGRSQKELDEAQRLVDEAQRVAIEKQSGVHDSR